MNTRDQFGSYLLLKKLGEDPLGETFRAGRMGKAGVERVVLLRIFNGQGIDGERLAQRIQARAGLHQALKSPNLGQGVDLGQVRGVPFLAYDYVSGKSLGALVEQAARKRAAIPMDHALLLAERIALGLGVAYETRMGDERVMHGFLTPHLVVVSNEGELRTLGFEASTGLREFAGHPLLKDAVGRYLAPEALAGQPTSKSDDVYSLGAILFELLTGQRVPMNPPGGFAATIDQAIVAADGTRLHPELADLLKRSLAPRDQRLPDSVAWHKSLAKTMSDGQYNPTTFNLAFFMHNLFREEIERETQELEVEATTQIAAPRAAVAAATRPQATPAAAAQQIRDSGPVREDTGVLKERYGVATPKTGESKTGLIAGGVAALLLLAGGAYWMFGRAKPGAGGTASPSADSAAAAPAPAVPATIPAQPTGPTPEEIQSQIQKMVDERIKNSSAQYEEQLKGLQRQLEDAKRAQAQQPTTAAAPRPVVPAPDPPPSSTASAPASPTTGAAKQPDPVTTATTTVQEPASAPAATVAPATEPARPATTEVQRGQLVELGPGVVAPRLVRRGVLRYPPLAQRMRKEATVTVRVLVDENGRVASAEGVGGKIGFGLDEAALDVARNSTYTAGTKGGVAIKVWTDLKIAFSLKEN